MAKYRSIKGKYGPAANFDSIKDFLDLCETTTGRTPRPLIGYRNNVYEGEIACDETLILERIPEGSGMAPDKPLWEKTDEGQRLVIGYNEDHMTSIVLNVHPDICAHHCWNWNVQARDGLGRVVLTLANGDDPDACGESYTYVDQKAAGDEAVKFARKFLIKALADLPD